ncbi:hypothetical protein BDV30DRAFT_240487 [Aspergillus minisclerotigenes]|uniref:HNH nuclease domain-containing protein n=1 Tax=Aspergillus minisclerotigenes TaxID=656917 RepID=A0A5N6J1N1_9EURO|nr:hypothetical protein BDV30DRAFT_240487 [Aspergillus minisclerotigenes]
MSTDKSNESWPLLAEKGRERIARYQPQDRPYDEILKPSLDAFIEWLPRGGRESIARDIVRANTDDDLYQVFANLFRGLAVPSKYKILNTGLDITKQSLGAVTTQSKPPADTDSETIAGILHPPRSPFHSLCLRRDSNKCVITGEMDTDYWESIGCPEDTYFAPTEGAHIIPFSYASWDNSTNLPHDRARAWEVLYRCFPEVRRAGLSGDTINDTSNGLTLRESLYYEFGKFNLALKPTAVEHKYEVKYFRNYPRSDRELLPESIELKKVEDAQELALPNCIFLDCHYRLAEILNASGMGVTIQRNVDKWKHLKVSAYNLEIREDGGTHIEKFLRAGLWQHIMR